MNGRHSGWIAVAAVMIVFAWGSPGFAGGGAIKGPDSAADAVSAELARDTFAGDLILNPAETAPAPLAADTGRAAKPPLTLYVNPVTGNDAWLGRPASRPKKTIQGAVDALPAALPSQTTIQLADGAYNEGVILRNIAFAGRNASLSIIHDPAAPGTAVIQPGASGATTGFLVQGIPQGVTIEDVTIQGFGEYGAQANMSALFLTGCAVQGNGIGARSSYNSRLQLVGCSIVGNNIGVNCIQNSQVTVHQTNIQDSTTDGVFVMGSSSIILTDSLVSGSGKFGIHLRSDSSAYIQYATIDGNGAPGGTWGGIRCYGNSHADVQQSAITNSGYAGVTVDRGSYLEFGNAGPSQLTGNPIAMYCIHRGGISYSRSMLTIANTTNTVVDGSSNIIPGS
ncbi:right-handed parallel beta-helix repeat-containing protein [Candidatus Poribacteria bacterium]|nr:right-handed parallel beta-helix repeat-containing protein [Candidatus Poribacteria bacterium]